MNTLISRYKLLLVALLAAGCVSVGPGAGTTTSSTPRAPVTSPTTIATTSTPEPKETPDLGKLQPGPIVQKDGKPIPDGEFLEYIALETESGELVTGVWISLQKDLMAFLQENYGFYEQSTIKIQDENFIRVIPATWMTSSKLAKVPEIRHTAGLTYANAKGELLISLTDAKPPEGFVVIGQASVEFSVLEVWKTQKDGVKVIWAGGLKS
jgi:hypothetical protein